MNKCQVCRHNESIYAFQPFGPDEHPHKHMAFLGSHYRGFPVIKICLICHDWIADGGLVQFTFKHVNYRYKLGQVNIVPRYGLSENILGETE